MLRVLGIKTIFFFFLFFLSPLLSASEIIEPFSAPSEIVVETERGIYPFLVEIADDARERGQGLMGRRSMAENQGMLFDMGTNRPTDFWMRDTYLSLDIVFIGEDGQVRHIHERAVPLSDTLIESGGPVRFVLELLGGTARRIGLKAGDRIRHPLIDAVAGN